MTSVDLFNSGFVSLALKHTHTHAHPLIQQQPQVINSQTGIVMSEPQNQGEGAPLGSTTQETSPPKIEITPAATGGSSLRRLSVLKLDPTPTKEEEHAIPQASTALPGTPAAEEKTADETSPVPVTSGTSDKPSTDPPMQSIVESSTQPTTTKSTNGTVPTSADPKTGVATVSKSWALLILAF